MLPGRPNRSPVVRLPQEVNVCRGYDSAAQCCHHQLPEGVPVNPFVAYVFDQPYDRVNVLNVLHQDGPEAAIKGVSCSLTHQLTSGPIGW